MWVNANLFRGLGNDFGVAETLSGVVVHHPNGLHERIANSRADKFKSAPVQILAHRVRFPRARRQLPTRLSRILPRRSANKLPDVTIEAAEFLLHFEKILRIPYRRSNFQPISHDA